MSPAVRVICGLTLAVLAILGSLFAASGGLEAQNSAPPIAAEDVLAGDNTVSAPAATSQEVVQPIPPYDPDDPFVIKRVLPIKGPIRYGEWHWDDAGVPSGPLVITVDLHARVLSVFRGGYEIGAAAVMLGSPSHPTPTGTFPILTKERHNVSEQYNNAPMPWTMRLTWDGVAVHGGSSVERGYASHGCVAAPDEFVSKIYEIARVGDVVIITDGVQTGVGGSLSS
jgi:lipoprotein-anchoring transpeptidase ErfK/SrfK